MRIVGTAGHIDHGKTSLVRALTGVDLDRLPEEQARGITIALGFTDVALPDGTSAASVDVPGHERLVRTMIAGATGLDAVLLCVAADDGVMPQTREHLAILELLGVGVGAMVLTKVDLVDDAEMLELAEEELRDVVAGTFLADAPIVRTSADTGEGLDALRALLVGFKPRTRAAGGPFRLPVDRGFLRDGFGAVVTGTTWSGALADGEVVSLLPSGERARVRGLQVHGTATNTIEAGVRAAVNLAGVELTEVPRGTVVCTGQIPSPHVLDVHYTHLGDAPELADGPGVRVLHGTAEVFGRLHVAANTDRLVPGVAVPAQLRLDTPLPCLPGDRFIVRRTSPVQTLGGGVVVDPWAPKMKRKNRQAAGAQIVRLHGGDHTVWLERAGDAGLDPTDWRERGGAGGVALGGRVLAPVIEARLRGLLLEALTEFHKDQPLSLGANRRELHRGRLQHLDPKIFDALVDRLAEMDALQLDGPMVRIAGFAVELTAEQRDLQARLRTAVTEVGAGGLAIKDLHAAHPQPEVAALMRLLERDGHVVSVPRMGWVAATVLDTVIAQVVDHFGTHARLTPQDFKERTGLSRKGAIPLLEWLDGQRITRRDGDARIQGQSTSRS